MSRTASATTFTLGALALTLAGCGALQSARDRIITPAPRCQDETVPIYFQQGAADITPDGRKVINEAADRARGCRVERVTVVGLADATGDAATNLELSKRRAQAVTAAFAAAKLPVGEFEQAGGGDIGATTAAGAAAPLRRRAEVTLHLKPPE